MKFQEITSRLIRNPPASQPRRGTPRRKGSKPAPAVAAHPVPEPLQEAIEVERGRLYEAETLLLCTLAAMENGDEERTDTPYFPVLIEMARQLVRTVLRRLDAVNLMKHAPAEK